MNTTSLDDTFNTFIVGACIDSFLRFRVTPSIGVWVHELLVISIQPRLNKLGTELIFSS